MVRWAIDAVGLAVLISREGPMGRTGPQTMRRDCLMLDSFYGPLLQYHKTTCRPQYAGPHLLMRACSRLPVRRQWPTVWACWGRRIVSMVTRRGHKRTTHPWTTECHLIPRTSALDVDAQRAHTQCASLSRSCTLGRAGMGAATITTGEIGSHASNRRTRTWTPSPCRKNSRHGDLNLYLSGCALVVSCPGPWRHPRCTRFNLRCP